MGENGELNRELPIRVSCGRDWDVDGVRIRFMQKPDPETRGRLLMVPTWRYTVPADGPGPEAYIRLSIEDAQMLMDKLYDCGLRPTQSHGSPGQIQAMEANLNDLRGLVKSLMTRIGQRASEPASEPPALQAVGAMEALLVNNLYCPACRAPLIVEQPRDAEGRVFCPNRKCPRHGTNYRVPTMVLEQI